MSPPYTFGFAKAKDKTKTKSTFQTLLIAMFSNNDFISHISHSNMDGYVAIGTLPREKKERRM